MKKRFLTLAFFAFAITFVSAQEIEVPQTQMSLINKVTADWCPYCGTWGWDFFHDLNTDNSAKAVVFAIHYSGGLQNQTASALTTNYGAVSQPRFILNGVDQNVLSNTTAAARESIQEKVNLEASMSPLAQTGLNATYRDDNMLYCNTRTTFFDAADGAYYMGIYLVEKQVIHQQASLGNNAQHLNVLRLSFTGNTFGTLLANGSIAAGTSFDYQFSIPKDSYTPSNLEIVSIIWKKEGETYKFVNANKDSDVEYEVVNGIQLPGIDESAFIISPNMIKDHANISFEMPEFTPSAQLSITDLQGKTVSVLHDGSLQQGTNGFEFYRSGHFPAGLYVVRLKIGNQVISRKIILE
ncbi:MAG: Omp28-related outer membrane protein [Saprospiraceae bacterium]|nr:Omp28-related outer membrane protein [Saprospiraceae bacterium]MCB9322522.1 Omp28-related outer membrane protein [Lewinellaceae bacterium]